MACANSVCPTCHQLIPEKTRSLMGSERGWMVHKVLACYPDSLSWRIKCKKMSDAQLIAIYYSFKKRGKIT